MICGRANIFGLTNKIPMTLDPWQPSLFALLAEKISGEDIVSALAKQAGRH